MDNDTPEHGTPGGYAEQPLLERLKALLAQYETVAKDCPAAGELRRESFAVLRRIEALVETHDLQDQGIQKLGRATFDALEGQVRIERAVEEHLPQPLASINGQENLLNVYLPAQVAHAVEQMRAKYDMLRAALEPFANLSVPEDYIPDYFTDTFYLDSHEAETTDFFIRRMDIRRAREALGTFPVPEGYPFLKKE
jgi:hypothetical protein